MSHKTYGQENSWPFILYTVIMYYWLIGVFALGVALQTAYPISLPTIIWLAMISGVVLLVVYRQPTMVYTPNVQLIGLSCFVLAAGLLRTELHSWQFIDTTLEVLEEQNTLISGIVIREPDIRERTVHLYVETGDETVLVTTDRHADVAYGDEILVSGRLELPTSFATDLGRTFDYQHYLKAKGVLHVMSFADVAVLRSDQANGLMDFLFAQKQQLMQGIESVLIEPMAGLAEGLLLGVKQALGEELETIFRQAGIIHIVVLSGYNIMLVVAFIRFVLGFFLRPRAQLLIGLLAISCFALTVGLSATVLRASIMASLFLFATTFAKRYHVLRALFLAGLIMLLINPYLLLYDIGFQLSFMATLGLVLAVPQFESTTATNPNPFAVRTYFFATIVTQIAVLPLLLYHIGEVSLVAVLVNVLVLPVVPIAMLGAFISGLVALVATPLALPIAVGTQFTLAYIIFVATWFAGLPFASVTIPAFDWYFVPFMYTGAALFYYLWRRQSSSSTEPLSDWEIVEENAVVETTTASNDTPVFFR